MESVRWGHFNLSVVLYGQSSVVNSTTLVMFFTFSNQSHCLHDFVLDRIYWKNILWHSELHWKPMWNFCDHFQSFPIIFADFQWLYLLFDIPLLWFDAPLLHQPTYDLSTYPKYICTFPIISNRFLSSHLWIFPPFTLLPYSNVTCHTFH